MEQRINEQYIIFDNAIPRCMFMHRDYAFVHFRNMCKQYVDHALNERNDLINKQKQLFQSHPHVLKTLTNMSNDHSIISPYILQEIVWNSAGTQLCKMNVNDPGIIGPNFCVHSNKYYYDPNHDSVCIITPSLSEAHTRQHFFSNNPSYHCPGVNDSGYQSTASNPNPWSTPLSCTPSPSHSHSPSSYYSSSHSHPNVEKKCVDRKDNNISDEIDILTQKLKELTKIDSIKDLNSVYQGVEDEVRLDKKIKKEKERMDKLYGNNDDLVLALSDDDELPNTSSDEPYPSDNTSDTSYTNDENDTDDINDESNYSGEYGSNESDFDSNFVCESETESVSSNSITNTKKEKTMEDKLSDLIVTRNQMFEKIKHREEIVNKANENLNQDLCDNRYKDQQRRIEEARQKEKVSIFASDKNTYLKMKSKIANHTLKESNITPLFNHKYQIIKFMEENDLILFTSNQSVEKESHIYSQLHKVLDSCEYMLDVHDSDSSNDPMDEIEDEYLTLCDDFLEKVTNLNNPIMTEKTMHGILNENPKIKEKLFNEPINQNIFDKDEDKDMYIDK
jgi:hypothetical protein